MSPLPLPKSRKAVLSLLLPPLHKAPQVTASLGRDDDLALPSWGPNCFGKTQDWKCRVKPYDTELSAGKQSKVQLIPVLQLQEFMVSCTRSCTENRVKDCRDECHQNQILEPRLSSTPLIPVSISAWFGKYPEISRHKKNPQGPQQMLILERMNCLPATISQLLHSQQIEKTQNGC